MPPSCPCHFLDLPPELIIQILGELAVTDLRKCEDTNNRFLRSLIRDSIVIQYGVDKQLACVEDTPYGARNYLVSDRVQELSRFRRAWLEFTCSRLRTVHFDPRTPDIDYFASDIYFLGQARDPESQLCMEIAYMDLSETIDPDTDRGWWHLEVGEPVLNFVSAIEEHNLLAIITYSHHKTIPEMSSVWILLRNFSTRQAHELAEQPRIRVHDAHIDDGVPIATLEIVGDHLLLVIRYHGIEDAVNKDINGEMLIYNWKTGLLRAAPVGISTIGATFLAEDVILMPSAKDNRMDILAIVPSGGVEAVLSLEFPPLSPGYSMTSFYCTGSPSPIGRASYAKPRNCRRYKSNFEQSLVTVFVEFSHGEDASEFIFVFPRSAFLPGIRSRLRSNNIEHTIMPWHAWGPLSTHWLNTDNMAPPLFRMSHGQRVACISPDARDTPAPIRVLDFNPDTARLVQQLEQQGHSLPLENITLHGVVLREWRVMNHPAFMTRVVSSLPYIETESTELFDYDTVAITEDSILGIKYVDLNNFQLESMDVLHFG
ncbi:hypothetical protein DFH06DRAFT_1190815 [Mycena polygramma]|nr:hypothetical protein DFH06DRAFT_1190815 [Mycena polygramma]